jgi:hypothetical protein
MHKDKEIQPCQSFKEQIMLSSANAISLMLKVLSNKRSIRLIKITQGENDANHQ